MPELTHICVNNMVKLDVYSGELYINRILEEPYGSKEREAVAMAFLLYRFAISKDMREEGAKKLLLSIINAQSYSESPLMCKHLS